MSHRLVLQTLRSGLQQEEVLLEVLPQQLMLMAILHKILVDKVTMAILCETSLKIGRVCSARCFQPTALQMMTMRKTINNMTTH